MFPDVSWVNVPVAATGPIAGMVPFVLNPHFAAPVAFVQAAWTPEVTANIDSIINIKSFVVFIEILRCGQWLWNLHSAVSNFHRRAQLSRSCYAINPSRHQYRASLLLRSSRYLSAVRL